MKIGGTFNGTGAAVYICLGFIPGIVNVRSVEDTDVANVVWNKYFRSAEQDNGILYYTAAGIVPTLYTAGEGIEPYEGGALMTTTNQTSVANGSGIFLKRDAKSYLATDIISGSDTIDTWTLDTSGNRTGHFNNDFVGTYVGEGSPIRIDGIEYIIEKCDAGEGEGDDEVTLSRAAASGTVEYIGNMYDYAPVPIGMVSPAGFKLCATSEINETDELQAFLADGFNSR